MILVDSSVWVDHFKAEIAALGTLLAEQQVLGHPFVVGELALGNLHNRLKTLFVLRRLPPARVARDRDVSDFVENHRLYGRGIGYVDTHLLASTLLTPEALLWSHDKRLMGVARDLGIAAEID